MPLGLSAAASATDAAIRMKIYGSGKTTLKISNKEMRDIMENKRLSSCLLGMLAATLGASLLGNMLAGKSYMTW